MAVKFPLKMADGAMVRTLEDLRDHFDLTTVLAYYDNGRLTKWLENGYYDEEAAAVAALHTDTADFTKKLCGILGVDYSENETASVDLGSIAKRNERLQRLKQYTADDTILAAVDRVAFSQEELVELLNQGATEIYLLGEQFTIPDGFEDVPYHCINNPVVRLEKLERLEASAGQGDAGAQIELGQYYAEQNDLDTAIKWYTQAIEQGSAEGLAALIRLDSKLAAGTELDDKLAAMGKGPEVVKWYTSAAEGGNVQAQVKLGGFYMAGWGGIALDRDEAVKWYTRAAEHGDAEARCKLGTYYYNVAEECWKKKKAKPYYQEAAKWFHLAANQGYAEAQFGLSNCYRYGEGVGKDTAEAVRWCQLAAEQGYETAVDYLLDDYMKEENISEAIKWYKIAVKAGYNSEDSSDAEFLMWYIRATEENDAEAQVEVGKYYECGSDSENENIDEDDDEAVSWYEKAAAQNYIGAFIRLIDYHWGEKEIGEAIKWYMKAVKAGYREVAESLKDADSRELFKLCMRANEQGDAETQTKIGVYCYNAGDDETAIKWFRLAANQGYAEAQYGLGVIYEDELDDEDEAIEWYRLAAEQGHSKAKDMLNALLNGDDDDDDDDE